MLKLRCSKHPRYKGEKSPRASCSPCIELYRLRLHALAMRLEVVGSKPTAKESQSE